MTGLLFQMCFDLCQNDLKAGETVQRGASTSKMHSSIEESPKSNGRSKNWKDNIDLTQWTTHKGEIGAATRG